MADEQDNQELPADAREGETIKEYVERVIRETLEGTTVRPEVPKVDHVPESPEEVQELATAFAEYRKEVAALRAELAAHRGRPAISHAPVETIEDRTNARLAAIGEHSHYCPGCGKLGKYAQKCEGTKAAPHREMEMVSTDELGGDPANHTAAPSTDPDDPAFIPLAA